MSIPLICGSYPSEVIEGVGGPCPVCRSQASVVLVVHSERLCFCFLPLCLVGGDERSACCRSCGARMPPSAFHPPPPPPACYPRSKDVGVGEDGVSASLLERF